MRLLKNDIQILIRIEIRRMTAGSTLRVTGEGMRIREKESVNSSYPIMMIMIETIIPAIYSIRPCPKGCSTSGLRPAIRKPTSVTADEPASERLFKASAVMAIEPEISPAVSLIRKRRMFKQIPAAPASIP